MGLILASYPVKCILSVLSWYFGKVPSSGRIMGHVVF